MGLVQKAFSDIITFSRSSNATRVGPTGLVEYAPHNLYTRSQEFENAAWTKTASSISANAAAAPDGTITADKVIEDSATSAHVVYQTPTVSAVVYTLSVFAKAAERTQVVLDFTGATNNAVFDLSAGTVVSFTGSGLTAAIQNSGNGWYRCSITQTQSAGTIFPSIGPASGGNRTYTGNGSSGILIWGAQLSVGPLALDYTPTTSAAVYGPRFDYDPVTLAARGLLVEEQRTNLATYSESFNAGGWSGDGGNTVVLNSTTSPDGTVNAARLSFSSTAYRYVGITTVVSSVYTFSMFAKLGTGGNNQVRLDGAGTATFFDLSSGTVVSTTATSASITPFGNGWYRCSCTFSATSTTTFITFAMPGTFTSGQGHFFWGGQMELGSFATSYAPTVASTVTRSADVASVNTLSPWFSNVEGTLYLEASRYATAANNEVPVSLDDTGGASSRMSTYTASSTNVLGEFIADGGATQANLATSAVTNNVPFKFGIAYKANDFAASKDGATVVTDTSGTVPTILRMTIGASFVIGAASQYNGHIRRIAYYPVRLSAAQLQALTA